MQLKTIFSSPTLRFFSKTGRPIMHHETDPAQIGTPVCPGFAKGGCVGIWLSFEMPGSLFFGVSVPPDYLLSELDI